MTDDKLNAALIAGEVALMRFVVVIALGPGAPLLVLSYLLESWPLAIATAYLGFCWSWRELFAAGWKGALTWGRA